MTIDCIRGIDYFEWRKILIRLLKVQNVLTVIIRNSKISVISTFKKQTGAFLQRYITYSLDGIDLDLQRIL